MSEDILMTLQGTRHTVGGLSSDIAAANTERQAIADRATQGAADARADYEALIETLRAERERARQMRAALVEHAQTTLHNLHDHAAALVATADNVTAQLIAVSAALADDAQAIVQHSQHAIETATQAIAHVGAQGDHVVTAAGDAARQAQQTSLVVLTEVSEAWATVSHAASVTIAAALDESLTQARDGFVQQVEAEAGELAKHLAEDGATLTNTIGQQVDEAQDAFRSRLESCEADLRAIAESVENLGELFKDQGGTLVDGAETATELMDATNVGARAVIKTFTNVQQIFHDILSA